jgi:hypothetical protein
MFGIRFLKLSAPTREFSSGGRPPRAENDYSSTGDDDHRPRARGTFDRGHLAAADLREVDDALRLVLGLL